MSLATSLVASELYGTEMKFELLYTSMDTGQFTDTGGALITLLFCFPLILYFYASAGMNVLEISDEPHE